MTLEEEIRSLINDGKSPDITRLCQKYRRKKSFVQDRIAEIRFPAKEIASLQQKDEMVEVKNKIAEKYAGPKMTVDEMIGFPDNLPQSTDSSGKPIWIVPEFPDFKKEDYGKVVYQSPPDLTIIPPILKAKLSRLYREKFAHPPSDSDLEALRSDAHANPEGSVDLLGLQFTQMLIQL